MEKLVTTTLELIPVHFTLCRQSVITLDQAEQCLVGIEAP